MLNISRREEVAKLVRNIADLIDPPHESKPEGKTWNEEEFDLFLTAAADSE